MPAVIKSQKIGAGRGAKGAKYGKKKTSNYKRDVPVQEPVVEEDYDDEQCMWAPHSVHCGLQQLTAPLILCETRRRD